jgi:predicted Zn-dependent protease
MHEPNHVLITNTALASTVLLTLGRVPEAIAAAKKALDPLSSTEWLFPGEHLTENVQFTAAHAAIRRTFEIQPESSRALDGLGTGPR